MDQPRFYIPIFFLLFDSFCHSRNRKPIISCYLSYSWGYKRGIDDFSKEIWGKVNATVSLAIWTRLVVSMSQDIFQYTHILIIFIFIYTKHILCQIRVRYFKSGSCHALFSISLHTLSYICMISIHFILSHMCSNTCV